MPDGARTILVIGYGNPGRGDDGLGPALANAIDACALPGVTVDTPYQLQVEDADTVARCDLVVFVDAAAEGAEPFACHLVEPAFEPGRTPVWTSHALAPGAVLALARDALGAEPPCVLVAVRGYEFGRFAERLSPRATANLEAAAAWLIGHLRDGGATLVQAKHAIDAEPIER